MWFLFYTGQFWSQSYQGAAVQFGWYRVAMGTITSHSPNNGSCSPGENYEHFVSPRVMMQGRIQDFPGRGLAYYLTKYPRKLHENEEKWTEMGVGVQNFII